MKGNFQLISIIVFIVLAIFGVLVFSGAIPIGSDNAPGALGTVTLWGTIKSATMFPLLEKFNAENPTFIVQYVEKSEDTLDQELLEALADDRGPDLLFLPDDLVFHYTNRIFTIPYESYSLASFKNNFAGAGEVFLTSTGVMAFPVSIDPLMLYYNRSILDANAVVYPPAFWDEVLALVPVLTKKDDTNKITKSAVALGHFSNVAHAKDILATLFMQGGNPIVVEQDGFFNSSLDKFSLSHSPVTSLKFYTSFADPNGSAYSWNKSFPNSDVAFSREDLAFYFGYASELPALVNKNPNQNFFVAPFPQIKNSNFKLTLAHTTGISILSSSRNFSTAFTAASKMATGDFAQQFALALGLPPARRDLLTKKPKDAYPSPKDTNEIFRRMVETSLSNSVSVDDAVSNANSRLDLLLR
jgi:ABC-type glycerol-3-phosphate transport system substrate-binding protein